jgi:hypothetical protein
MESDSAFRRYRERSERLDKRLAEINSQTNAILKSLGQSAPNASAVARLQVLRDRRAQLFRDYLEHADAFTAYLIEQEATNRRSVMTAKRPKAPRSQAQIEKVSAELTTNLRLERVDDAIKELLAFLEDTDFFSQNAPAGRRRRLRTLQGAIEKALA